MFSSEMQSAYDETSSARTEALIAVVRGLTGINALTVGSPAPKAIPLSQPLLQAISTSSSRRYGDE